MRKSLPSAKPPKPGEGKRGEEGHLGYLLRQAGAANARAHGKRFVGPRRHAAAIRRFDDGRRLPGLSSADLARLSLLTPPTVTVIVGNLKRSGALVSRPHAVHGRIQQLEITEAGKKLLARCKSRVDAVKSQLAAGLTEEESGRSASG